MTMNIHIKMTTKQKGQPYSIEQEKDGNLENGIKFITICKRVDNKNQTFIFK